MALTPEQWQEMEKMAATVPTVDVRVDIDGNLTIDGSIICRNFAKKLGPESLLVEIAFMRAITKAEERTREKITTELGRIGIRVSL